MRVPPEITLKGLEATPLLEKHISDGIAKLEQVCDFIISVGLIVAREQGRHRTGNPYRVRIDIRIPENKEIVLTRYSKASTDVPDGLGVEDTIATVAGETEATEYRPTRRSPVQRRAPREEPLLALIRRSFDSARRELQKVVEKQRGAVKTPAYQSAMAVVEKIFRSKGYGFIRTLDGEQAYFHKNSVLHNHWAELTVGTMVRYTLEVGEKGLQASTVEPVSKAGVAEAHDVLHDLSVAVDRKT